MINDFSTYLQQQLKEGLPGKTAHQEAAPYRKVDFDLTAIQAAKKSAVLILFYQKEGEIKTALIQRTVYKGKHSGQVSFPGGKVEKTDTSIFDTALREANEEIGILKTDVTIIGQLSNVFIPVSNFHVVPILAITQQTPKFILQKREVESVIEIDIRHFISTPLSLNKVKLSNDVLIKVPTFKIQEKIVWGATALMLNELKYILSSW